MNINFLRAQLDPDFFTPRGALLSPRVPLSKRPEFLLYHAMQQQQRADKGQRPRRLSYGPVMQYFGWAFVIGWGYLHGYALGAAQGTHEVVRSFEQVMGAQTAKYKAQADSLDNEAAKARRVMEADTLPEGVSL